MNKNIHPTAIISENAKVHPSVKIGPYCIVDAGVELDEGCALDCYVRIYANVKVGKNNRFCQGTAIGVEPQDLTFEPKNTKPLVIGDNNHFKENITVSVGVKEAHGTRIGSHNYFMHGTHIAHDCILGDNNILANNVTFGGHITVEDNTFISGNVAIHQFCRIGAYVMIGGVSAVVQDVPPYCMANGQRARFMGLNLVGLKRSGFNPVQRKKIKHAYHLLFQSGKAFNTALTELKKIASTPEEQAIIHFIEQSDRGLISA